MAMILDEIKDEGFFVVIIRMQYANIWIESCDDTSFFHFAIQHSKSIIQHAVVFISCWSGTPALELIRFGEEKRDRRKVFLRTVAFYCHDIESFILHAPSDFPEFFYIYVQFVNDFVYFICFGGPFICKYFQMMSGLFYFVDNPMFGED